MSEQELKDDIAFDCFLAELRNRCYCNPSVSHVVSLAHYM